jgi:cytosine/adenosine deaminase-related metal-dependent hydrolase
MRPDGDSPVDLLIADALLVATLDDERREIPGGWVAISDGFISAVGAPGSEPPARRRLSACDCLVTPGLVNTHHHMWQNLTRSYRPVTAAPFLQWLQTLYPLWARLDEEAVFVSAWIGLAELALGGCTTTTDHLYIHPRRSGDLISAEIAAAAEVGLRFHPTHGSIDLSESRGGLAPDDLVRDVDEILADSERLAAQHHDPSAGAMVRLALAPHSLMCASRALMQQTAELADRLGLRLHTHLAADRTDDEFARRRFGCRPVEYFDSIGWLSDQTWVAHCIRPDPDEVTRIGRARVGVAHCPSASMLSGAGLAPIAELREAGSSVGLACDGSADSDTASMWIEARTALLIGRLRHGAPAMQARDVLDMATREGAACLGREGELGVLTPGAVGDVVAWPQDGLRFAGAVSDPIEAWLRCGPTSPRHTVVAGRPVVEDGELRLREVEEMLRRHRTLAEAMQGAGVRA